MTQSHAQSDGADKTDGTIAKEVLMDMRHHLQTLNTAQFDVIYAAVMGEHKRRVGVDLAPGEPSDAEIERMTPQQMDDYIAGGAAA